MNVYYFLSAALYCISMSTVLSAYKVQPVNVLRTLAHNKTLFTQGLSYHPPYLYESSGLYGSSKIIQYTWPSMTIIKEKPIKHSWFAEGLTLLNNKLVVLTWREHTALVIDKHTFKVKKTHTYPHEGWGLTTDNKHYIMTTGNHCILFKNSAFKTIKTLCLKEKIASSWQLNDITYHNGFLYANVWYQDIIVKIDPLKGEIDTIYDASALRKALPKPHNAEVLNGITSIGSNKLLITGKYWPMMFEIAT